MSNPKKLYENLPETPGVYFMRGTKGAILYIGKAGNLKRRVSSYFLRPLEYRLQKMVSEIKKIDVKQTDTSLEALILESQLIKKYKPPYNVREKDDKSFLFVEITKDEFPRVLLVRGKDIKKDEIVNAKGSIERYGPFVEAGSLKEALRLIRKIFPFNTHTKEEIDKFLRKESRPCFNWQIGLCPGVCASAISVNEYVKTIRNIKLIFNGKKRHLIEVLEKEMRDAALLQEFELAEKKKRQLFALQHINDIALIRESELSTINYQLDTRIEGYDISNISGTSAVGSMVVFIKNKPAKNEYKKFKIRTITGANDVGMLKEVLNRRLKHFEWPFPNLFLIDGGKSQVNAVREVISEFGIEIPVVGIAKGPERKKNEFIGVIPRDTDKNILIRVRDEAHRFAISYHRKLRGKIL
ncbi:MAG: GIY-YIG nuclease family protein [bacterium]|nr:GIY-YIG nuclease family protein [bacterium]